MKAFATILAILFLVSCGGNPPPPAHPEEPVAAAEPPPAPEPPPPAAPEPPPAPAEPQIPDAVTAGPDTYKVLAENDTVRVFDVNIKAGGKVDMHQHPDHVAYVLKPGKLKLSAPEGEPAEMNLKKGMTAFLPAGAHATENVGKKDVQAVVVELKKKGQPAPAGEDPVKVGKKNYKVLFDDEHVRVLEVKIPKKGKIATHAHPDHLVYVISGGKLELTQEGGEPTAFDLAAGQAVFLPAQAHSAVNTGTTAIKGIVFEIK